MISKKLCIAGFLFILISGVGFSQDSNLKEVQYLSGTDNENTVAWDFYCTGGRNSGYWTTIQVPSCWEQQGFGTYNYGRDYVTYGKNFRFADEKGIYKHQFTVPDKWKNKAVYIVFEGSMTDTEVKINGKLAGPIHQGAFYRFKYNISDKIDFGKDNLLEVTVSKMSSDKSVNNAERLADYWIFGGIFRPVYLEAYPQEHIDYTSIDAKADGSFSMNVYLKNPKAKREVHATIMDAEGKIVGTAQATVQKNDTLVNLKTTVNDPLLWSAETPHLYRVVTAIQAEKNKLYESTDRFGFRTIEIRRGDGIYLNGQQIKMKGINRHVWWPETGRTVSPAIDLKDVQLMKEMNMNAVRCSHYPPDKSFLEYCDSLGLYVLDELAGWQTAYSTKAGKPLVRELVKRDANHPSVIFWSNGNEGGHNFDLVDEYAKYDHSNRPVIHGHHRPGNAFNGIDCNHYENYYSSQQILSDSLIYMTTEFLHSQDDGGGGTSLADFWELHWNAERSGGGFLWALVDEGVVRTDFNGVIDVNRVNAPDGVVGPHRQKEGSFYAIREIFSPVKITMKKLPESFNGRIAVENRYHFTNLSECSFQWELVNYRKPGELFAGNKVMKKGRGVGPSVAPGETGSLQLNLPSDWKDHDLLQLSAYDQHEALIYTWTWNIKNNEALLDGIVQLETDAVAELEETDSTIALSGGDITVVLSKKDGTIVALQNKTSYSLDFGNGPVLVGGDAKLSGIKHYKEGKTQVVEVGYEGDMRYAKWIMHGNGWLSLEYEYALIGEHPFTGISFTYPDNFVIGAKWLGKGPYRVWKNRTQGLSHNVWENLYNDTHTGSAPWIYPEFKGYFADITWMEFNTAQGKFLVATKEDDLFVRRLDFYGLSGIKPHPDLPVGNISFLDNIPPLGTKLALRISSNTKDLGPEGELNKVDGPIKRTLYFYFGLPETENTAPLQYNVPAQNELF